MIETRGINFEEMVQASAVVETPVATEEPKEVPSQPITLDEIDAPMGLLVESKKGAQIVLGAASRTVVGFYTEMGWDTTRVDLLTRGLEKTRGQLEVDLFSPDHKTAATARMDAFTLIDKALILSTTPITVFQKNGVRRG